MNLLIHALDNVGQTDVHSLPAAIQQTIQKILVNYQENV